jgi:RNA polymerase sigma-70 factor, ECF subfamily
MDDASDSDRPAARDELGQWFVDFYPRLHVAVRMRFPNDLLGRLDPSDVIQEAFVEATQRYPEYRTNGRLPPYLWMHLLTLQRLQIIERRHLGAKKRSINRETAMPQLDVSSAALAEFLVDSNTTPGHSAMKHEMIESVRAALESMPPDYRELLVLRHFEQLSHAEAALALDISPAAARQKYRRALERLAEIVDPIVNECES